MTASCPSDGRVAKDRNNWISFRRARPSRAPREACRPTRPVVVDIIGETSLGRRAYLAELFLNLFGRLAEVVRPPMTTR